MFKLYKIKVKWKYLSTSIPVTENLLDDVVGTATVVVASVVIPVPSVAVFVPSVAAFVSFPIFENKVLHRTWMNK